MKASEARKITDQGKLLSTTLQFARVMSKIEERARQGNDHLWLYEQEIPVIEVWKRLEDNGYTVHPAVSVRNELAMKIEW